MFQTRLLKVWSVAFFSSFFVFFVLFYAADHFSFNFSPKSKSFFSEFESDSEGQRNSTSLEFSNTRPHLSVLKYSKFKRAGKQKSTGTHSKEKRTRLGSKSNIRKAEKETKSAKRRSRLALKSQENLSFEYGLKTYPAIVQPTKSHTRFNLKSQSYRSFRQVPQVGTTTITSGKPTDTSPLIALQKSQSTPKVKVRATVSTYPTSLNPTDLTTYFTMKSSSNPSFSREATKNSKHLTDTGNHHLTYTFSRSSMTSQNHPSTTATTFNPTYLDTVDKNTHYGLKSQNYPSTFAQPEKIIPTIKATQPRVVLIYTEFFGSYPWQGLENSHSLTHFKGKPCPVQNCIVSYKKDDFSSSDVVIFHGRDLPSVNKLRDLHSKRPSKQAWVFFILESPAHSPDARQYGGLFNWTMTYRTDSDIYYPYGFYTPLDADDEKRKVSTDYSLGKDKLIVWTVSNCAGTRLDYVNKLKEFVTVDIFGACGSNHCLRGADECSKILQSYKFQLAFENTECLDYVTEKYWGSPIQNSIVPIVLGGADYKKIAIPGSYINVLDFPSVKALADYLLYLDKNNTAYNEYFSWKTKYKLGGVLQNGLADSYHWTCDLCALANNASIKSKVYEHLEHFWSTEQCHLFSDQFQRIIY